VNIWVNLSPATRTRLVGTDLATKETELIALAELPPARQGMVLDQILGESPAKNVAQALEILENKVLPSEAVRQVQAVTKLFEKLADPVLDAVIAAHEERILASLKRQGRI
jgi:ParB family transcriptional regulator, chromosome partitioning protein